MLAWWMIKDAFYLWFGFTTTLIDLILDNLNPFSPKVPKLEDLSNLEYLSQLLRKPVVAIEEDGKQASIEAGGGGNGTCRRALKVHLADGKIMHIFAKTPAATLMERVFLTFFKVYNNELHFYKDLRKQWIQRLDIRDSWQPFPDVYCVKDYGRGKFLLILEDTRYRPEGCIFKTILQEPVDSEAIKSICHTFSQQHVAFWRCPPSSVWSYSPETGLPSKNTPPVVRLLLEGALSIVKKKFGSRLRLTPKVEETFHLLLAKYHIVRKFWSTEPVTLCHGDSHMGNLFFDSSMKKVGFVDFQCLSVEHCLRDISYHLFNSYPPDVLVNIEEMIIGYYLDTLAAEMRSRGKAHLLPDIPSQAQAMFYYRSYSLWVLIAWVVCCAFSDFVMEKYALESLQRIFDNCERLDSLEVLQSILSST